MAPLNQSEFTQNYKDIPNLLIGNGFALSHPYFGGAFKWDMKAALEKSWDSVLKINSDGTPERDLLLVRKKIVKLILEYYIKVLSDEISGRNNSTLSLKNLFRDYNNKPCECTEFLRNRKHIFTLNYDPILYFEILRNKDFFDGFVYKNDNGQDGCIKEFYGNDSSEKGYLKQEYIICKLKKNEKKANVYFIHGSWFIVYNKREELRKLVFSNDEDCIDSLFSGENTPLFILEDRWKMKKALIDECPYLDFCYQRLEKEIKGEILVFGCSFDKDDHIIKALNDNAEIKKIYITHLEENVEEKLKRYFPNKTVIPIFIDKNVIWETKAI